MAPKSRLTAGSAKRDSNWLDFLNKFEFDALLFFKPLEAFLLRGGLWFLSLALVSITQAGSKRRTTPTGKGLSLEMDKREKRLGIRRGRRERGIWRV